MSQNRHPGDCTHSARAPGSACAAVNIITARASTEAAGEGITGSLVTQIVDSSTQTVSREAVSSPATLTNYTSSESQDVTNAEQELTTAVRNCPSQKQVLLGYLQGGRGGDGRHRGQRRDRRDRPAGQHLDQQPYRGHRGLRRSRHVAGRSWHLGTAALNGLFPRSSTQRQMLSAFGSSKISAWCDSGDPYCASGLDLTVHLTYLDRYQNAATSVVLGKIGG